MTREAVGRWAAALAAAGALVATPAAATESDPARTQLEQRIKLAAALMADSATAQRIASSGNARARSHLDEGRVHQSLAVDLMAKGDLAGARAAVDEALKHLGLARRLAPDQSAQQAAARQRYAELESSLDRLLASWRQRMGPGGAGDNDLVAAIGLIGTARGLAQDNRHEEAVAKLVSAELHVLAGMNRTLIDRTLDYTARASTPAEEFELELARHRSLIELVPVAVADLKPKADARLLIERYTETSNALRQQAQQQMQAGDVQQALAQIRNAVLFVQRALTSAGLVIPQPTGN